MGRHRAVVFARRVSTLVEQLSRVAGTLAASLLLLMLTSSVADIFSRSVLGRPLRGVFEYTEVTMAAIVFLGLPYTMQAGGHVAIDSITRRLPGAWRRVAEAASLLAVLPVLVWVTIASAGVARTSFAARESKFGVVSAPVWPARVLIPVGVGLLAGEVVLALVRTYALSGRQRSAPTPPDLV